MFLVDENFENMTVPSTTGINNSERIFFIIPIEGFQ